MSENKLEGKKISERIEIIVDEARAGAESIGESVKDTLQGALSARENVVMVRLNKESLSKLNELVDAGLVNSRSEAAALLVSDGIKARADLFGRIAEKIGEIRKAKDALKDLLDESPNDNQAAGDGRQDD